MNQAISIDGVTVPENPAQTVEFQLASQVQATTSEQQMDGANAAAGTALMLGFIILFAWVMSRFFSRGSK